MSDGALRALPAARVVGFVADAAERWADADFAPRVRATRAIVDRLGYSEPVVDYALDRLFFGITRASLEATIVAELGSLAALDGPVARHGTPSGWARGVDRAVIVSSDTTIGVALVPAVFALCAKCDLVVKDRSDALVAAFFASLAEEHPAFAHAALARSWSGGEDPGEDALFARADVVVAFGRDQTLRAIRARSGVQTRFVPFGHRISVGRLHAAEVAAADEALLAGIARDALLYDGEGCLSLHALFVEADDVELTEFAVRLAAACERVAVEFPAGRIDAARGARAAAYRQLAAFRAASGRGAVLRAADATIVAEAPLDDPLPLVARTLPIYRGDDATLAAYVAAQRLPVQALGVAHVDDAAIALAARLGAVRAAALGTMQDPPLAGRHGGEQRIAPFVRWIDAR
ncbi:MAG TPA: acyl-CoA reductase [Candidatus Sulfotelmatobacter sp.]|nr:acyl-CoA reductase [Candidatus Sulfotelmatobacter sp.]